MKKTLIFEPEFTWLGSILFCGGVFLVRLNGPSDDVGRYQLQEAEFFEKIMEIGWNCWDGRAFNIIASSRDEAKKQVESLYRTAFDCMEFKASVK